MDVLGRIRETKRAFDAFAEAADRKLAEATERIEARRAAQGGGAASAEDVIARNDRLLEQWEAELSGSRATDEKFEQILRGTAKASASGSPPRPSSASAGRAIPQGAARPRQPPARRAPSDPKGYYRLLEVSPGATPEEIKKAFRRLARQYHPDVNHDRGAEEMFKKINEAYEILGDAEKRKAYDAPPFDPRRGL